jgi:hypothetical protein
LPPFGDGRLEAEARKPTDEGRYARRGIAHPTDRRTIGTAKGENNGTAARVAADGKPLRSERGIREVERNVFRVRVRAVWDCGARRDIFTRWEPKIY